MDAERTNGASGTIRGGPSFASAPAEDDDAGAARGGRMGGKGSTSGAPNGLGFAGTRTAGIAVWHEQQLWGGHGAGNLGGN